MTFFDSDENRLVSVGMYDNGIRAGLFGFDGNTLAPGTGVNRVGFGIASSTSINPGFGMFVYGPEGYSLDRRIGIGSSLDGTTFPSAVDLFDSTGTLRTGVEVEPCTNFVGFFSGIYTLPASFSTCPTGATGPNESIIGNAYDNSASYAQMFDSSGNLRNGIEYYPPDNFNGFFSQDGSGHNMSNIGNASDNSSSYAWLFDSSGNLRNGIEYYPPANFNGFFSQDGAGHSLSSVGNFLITDAGLSEQANESYLDLSDTTGTLRLFEFQNSTNEGGIDFNPGSTTVQGSWGNP